MDGIVILQCQKLGHLCLRGNNHSPGNLLRVPEWQWLPPLPAEVKLSRLQNGSFWLPWEHSEQCEQAKSVQGLRTSCYLTFGIHRASRRAAAVSHFVTGVSENYASLSCTPTCVSPHNPQRPVCLPLSICISFLALY